jgi:hypothetical protein
MLPSHCTDNLTIYFFLSNRPIYQQILISQMMMRIAVVTSNKHVKAKVYEETASTIAAFMALLVL